MLRRSSPGWEPCPACAGCLPGDGPDWAVCRCGAGWLPDADALIEEMAPHAAELVMHVRDMRVMACRRLLAGLSVVQLQALAVALAALVPDGEELEVLAAWTRRVPRPVSRRQQVAHRRALEAELAAAARERRRRGDPSVRGAGAGR